MKKLIFTITIIAVIFSTLKAQTNDLMPKTLRIESSVIFDNKENTYPEKREFQKKDLFIVIMEKVMKGEVISYESYNSWDIYNIKSKKFTIKDIEERMGAVDAVVMVENVNDPNAPMIEKTIEGEYYLEEIKGIAFLDEWYFDAQNFSFTKKTIAYTPVRSYTKEYSIDDETGQTVRSKVCTLNFENLSKKQIKKSNKRLLHYATVKYEQKIYNNSEYKTNVNLGIYGEHYEHEYAPLLTTYARKMIVETIFNKVESGEKTAYDFSSQKKITFEEIKGRMGAKDMAVMIDDIENPDGPQIERIIEGEYSLEDIKSYIFTEDWYLDPVTLRIVKKVRAIAPVRYYIRIDSDNKEAIRKIIVFEVKFE